ncbi:mitochondrial K+-H+ exchange-related-domain-containing protein [Cyathus striatus]|nr:mitochondrial K+-H+ exchange-related-domain-containing protein [Cyathus striatus]
MSVSRTARKMRIIAIPLTRPKPGIPSTTRPNSLTYYQFQITKSPPSSADIALKDQGNRPSWWPEEGVVNWATGKASNIWAGFGKAEGGLKTYQLGEKLVDRLDFEELALKGIDPSLGPSLTGSKKIKEDGELVHIPLIYPPSLHSGPGSLYELQSLLAYRTPRHRKGFFMWMAIAPLTAPFMIIPIIPNLPFFFCVWRSWSHYRAYKASQYLTNLLESGAIVPEASERLDEIYKHYPPRSSSSSSEPTSNSSDAGYKDSSTSLPKEPTSSIIPSTEPASSQGPEPQHKLLLTRDAIPAILALFELKSNAGSDMLRAVEQARVRVASGRTEL